ncbi:hypothetical protein Ancab_017763 [Ancistrocladus abbreviatus]
MPRSNCPRRHWPAAGDEVAASIAPLGPVLGEQDGLQKLEESEEPKDPFAANDATGRPESLGGEFKKDMDAESNVTKALDLQGDYGGMEFCNDQASLWETFEGFSDAFGGGLDASEFAGSTKAAREDLGGLELLQIGPDAAAVAAAAASAGGAPLENLLVQREMKGPEWYNSEEIFSC